MKSICRPDSSSLVVLPVSYEVMHSCWSPVPKCRPSFQHLVSQLEALCLSLSPAHPLKEPLLYVNLEGGEGGGEDGARGPEMGGGGAPSWSVPWQRQPETEEKDWLMVGSEVALAIGGDYRYIIGRCGAPEEEPMDPLQVRDDDDVINV